MIGDFSKQKSTCELRTDAFVLILYFQVTIGFSISRILSRDFDLV